MSTRLRCSAPALLQVATVLLAASPSVAAGWENIDGYQPKANVNGAVYVPAKVDASPGVVVSIHYCGGSATSGQGWFKGSADQYGFLIIAPDAPGGCFDAAPGRSGERADIAAMVDAVVKNYGADPTRVFSAGASSGACMTNTMLASYPDVFAAGSVLAGVPVGFWTGGGNCSVCSQNPPQKSAQEWGDIVRDAAAGNGPPWPRVQLWHGTSDTTLNYTNLAEEFKQWANVMGLDNGNSTQQDNTPSSGWTRTSYEDGSGTVMLQVNVLQGGPHDLTSLNPQLWPEIVKFFGLDQDVAPGSGGSDNTGGTDGVGGTSSGGVSAGGASGGAGAVPGSSSSSSEGCSCEISGARDDGGWLAVVLAGLSALIRRRRRL